MSNMWFSELLDNPFPRIHFKESPNSTTPRAGTRPRTTLRPDCDTLAIPLIRLCAGAIRSTQGRASCTRELAPVPLPDVEPVCRERKAPLVLVSAAI